ncbi:uncharacterized protein LOC112460892 [Temnothorax curvispinosus]|uniref:Uncharacterized protein LOC112460892 n=1 Tax=Temnothorax curvispinosus TaxID=300111 RepID=A0A6J1QGU6_9HYME|nr:uncharacterized protein LOC112460892 [Temnothorax curvispinosus]
MSKRCLYDIFYACVLPEYLLLLEFCFSVSYSDINCKALDLISASVSSKMHFKHMKNSCGIFTAYLIVAVLLISTFVIMVIAEPNVIQVPLKDCPAGQLRNAKLECTEIWE